MNAFDSNFVEEVASQLSQQIGMDIASPYISKSGDGGEEK